MTSIAVIGITLGSCVKSPSTAELDSDIKAVDGDLEEARIDSASFGENRLAASVAEQRVQILSHSKAMLEQKRKAMLRGIRLTYSVDGKEFKRPEDWEARLKALDEEIIKAKGAVRRGKNSEGGIGGLFGLIAAAGGSIASLDVSLLEHKRLLLKHEIPAYALTVKENQAAATQKTNVKSGPEKTNPAPKAIKPPPTPKRQPSIELVSFKREHLLPDRGESRYSMAVPYIPQLAGRLL